MLGKKIMRRNELRQLKCVWQTNPSHDFHKEHQSIEEEMNLFILAKVSQKIMQVKEEQNKLNNAQGAFSY